MSLQHPSTYETLDLAPTVIDSSKSRGVNSQDLVSTLLSSDPTPERSQSCPTHSSNQHVQSTPTTAHTETIYDSRSSCPVIPVYIRYFGVHLNIPILRPCHSWDHFAKTWTETLIQKNPDLPKPWHCAMVRKVGTLFIHCLTRWSHGKCIQATRAFMSDRFSSCFPEIMDGAEDPKPSQCSSRTLCASIGNSPMFGSRNQHVIRSLPVHFSREEFDGQLLDTLTPKERCSKCYLGGGHDNFCPYSSDYNPRIIDDSWRKALSANEPDSDESNRTADDQWFCLPTRPIDLSFMLSFRGAIFVHSSDTHAPWPSPNPDCKLHLKYWLSRNGEPDLIHSPPDFAPIRPNWGDDSIDHHLEAYATIIHADTRNNQRSNSSYGTNTKILGHDGAIDSHISSSSMLNNATSQVISREMREKTRQMNSTSVVVDTTLLNETSQSRQPETESSDTMLTHTSSTTSSSTVMTPVTNSSLGQFSGSHCTLNNTSEEMNSVQSVVSQVHSSSNRNVSRGRKRHKAWETVFRDCKSHSLPNEVDLSSDSIPGNIRVQSHYSISPQAPDGYSVPKRTSKSEEQDLMKGEAKQPKVGDESPLENNPRALVLHGEKWSGADDAISQCSVEPELRFADGHPPSWEDMVARFKVFPSMMIPRKLLIGDQDGHVGDFVGSFSSEITNLRVPFTQVYGSSMYRGG